jgi:pimeloyl-ACP methyl ester carboxylesterase
MTELVMIPAFGCDEGLYARLLPHLPPNVLCTTVLVDGGTMAQCVEQVLARAPATFVVLGTSFGGRVALETALAAPERVSGLIVIGSSAGPVADPQAGQRRSSRLRAGEADQVVAEMAAMIAHMDGPRGQAACDAFAEMSRRVGSGVMVRQSDVLAKRGDLWPRLAEVSCPALMLWGKHDKFAAAADGRRMAAAMARGSYAELPDCGHFPSLEYPEETAVAIDRWLAAEGLAASA